MSGKKKLRRRKNIRRRRKINPVQAAVAALAAAAGLMALVCVTVYVAGRFAGGESTGKVTDLVNEKGGSGTDTAGTPKEILRDLQKGSAAEGTENAAAVKETGKEPAPSGEEMEASVSMEEQGQQETPEETGGPTLSILGDSISTFQGYIPAGYYDFFPGNGTVSDVDQTWWKRVSDELGLTLYVNGSSSGATCVGDSTGTADPQCGCNEFRTGALYGPGQAAPDIIIVYMGTNDLLQSIPLGDNDGTRRPAEGVVAAFGDAYTLMLDKLLDKYPSSRIYCCTMLPVGDYGTSTPYVDFVNGEGLTAADYNARISQIAASKKLPVIDLYTCGIAVENLHNTTVDGVHPTPDGMAYIAEKVKEALGD